MTTALFAAGQNQSHDRSTGSLKRLGGQWTDGILGDAYGTPIDPDEDLYDRTAARGGRRGDRKRHPAVTSLGTPGLAPAAYTNVEPNAPNADTGIEQEDDDVSMPDHDDPEPVRANTGGRSAARRPVHAAGRDAGPKPIARAHRRPQIGPDARLATLINGLVGRVKRLRGRDELRPLAAARAVTGPSAPPGGSTAPTARHDVDATPSWIDKGFDAALLRH